MEKNQYLDMFIDESTEHLQAMNDNLLKLENAPDDHSIIDEIFRSAHTLKGMAATMGYEDLASLTHQMENVLDGIRNGKIAADSHLLDVVFESVDDLEAMVNDIADGGEGKRDVTAVVAKLEKIENGVSVDEVAATVEKTTVPVKESSTGVRFDDFEITVLKQSKEQGFNAYYVNVLLREDVILKAARVFMAFEVLEQIGEVIKSVPSVDQLEEENFDLDFSVTLVTKESVEDVHSRIMKVSEIDRVDIVTIDADTINDQEQPSEGAVEAAEEILEQEDTKDDKPSTSQQKESKGAQGTNKTIRVNIDRLDSLMNLFEELVIDRGRLEQISSDLKSSELTETVEHMSRISGDLQNIILNMRMVPVEQVFNRFPRMVRGIAKDLNKKVHLEIIGAETELDRTVIDEIGDPLVHLLRNSMDHGLEMPAKRLESGKSEEGQVTLKAYHSGNHVFIEVADDGAGINREKVLEKAIKSGVVSEENGATLTDNQVYELLFSSGLSTADKVSDLSGRGVGLDVVKNKIESLGGNVTVTSKPNEGTTFSIQLPLTLSIISVMLVEIQDEIYAVPLSSIIETAIIKKDEIMAAHNQKVIDFRGSVVPLLDLTEFFDVPVTKEDDDFYSIVIVRKGEKMAALVVNSFIGQQEIVLKSLGDYLTNVFAISGATILGNGQVALIIDCNSLIK
ncbi:chemotaxis protein CheA [Salipaludibacillus agaradhaerens]|uniref:chemotaxis protein CheA n=1 Tax=Salipaludibacillus agaradhaerens TaxID=76935 RepID=UPI0021515EE4|nr:chemotaxis protein CheA [Salipaludibacillus agaradhaerens]MCR6107049.1 chemotaxis protein CheA [Salipaludibacillus agaradhaerens]MCR6119080.1 chemotaxis protein CheA [Salipaludibacillus agaradhaerens]UJW58131.1 chemotaxis protein CheA [Bacillus sp. A116_S68]